MRIAIVSVLLETLTMMAVGAFLGVRDFDFRAASLDAYISLIALGMARRRGCRRCRRLRGGSPGLACGRHASRTEDAEPPAANSADDIEAKLARHQFPAA